MKIIENFIENFANWLESLSFEWLAILTPLWLLLTPLFLAIKVYLYLTREYDELDENIE